MASLINKVFNDSVCYKVIGDKIITKKRYKIKYSITDNPNYPIVLESQGSSKSFKLHLISKSDVLKIGERALFASEWTLDDDIERITQANFLKEFPMDTFIYKFYSYNKESCPCKENHLKSVKIIIIIINHYLIIIIIICDV